MLLPNIWVNKNVWNNYKTLKTIKHIYVINLSTY